MHDEAAEASGITRILPKDFIGSAGDGTCTIDWPEEVTPENTLNEILVAARENDVSDVHLCCSSPVIFRRYGELHPLTDWTLTTDLMIKIVGPDVPEEYLSAVRNPGDCEFIHTIPGAGRFRITLMRQRDGFDLTARCIPMSIRSFEDAGMPTSCAGLTRWAQGLVLVTGPASCGKSSTLSTLVDMINTERDEHIITIENPIETIYTPKQCQITQRQVDLHTLSQGNALKAALREDPDIIVVSELRELESIELAVSAAETGHLVLGTMNTTGATQTVSTLVDSFPPEDKSIMTNMISESLRGIVSQQLIPRKDGNGMVPAYEVLLMTTAIANLIRDDKAEQLTNMMITQRQVGMVVLDESLQNLVDQDIITGKEAYRHAVNQAAFSQYV